MNNTIAVADKQKIRCRAPSELNLINGHTFFLRRVNSTRHDTHAGVSLNNEAAVMFYGEDSKRKITPHPLSMQDVRWTLSHHAIS